MAELHALENALRKADAAGAEDDARALALEIRRQRKVAADTRARTGDLIPLDPDVPFLEGQRTNVREGEHGDRMGVLEDYTKASVFNSRLAGTAGYIPDVLGAGVNKASEALGGEFRVERAPFGEKRIRGAIEEYFGPVAPPYAEPQTVGQAAFAEFGSMVGITPGLALGAKTLAKYGGKKIGPLVQRWIIDAYKNAPWRTGALETTGALLSGAGGYVGGELNPPTAPYDFDKGELVGNVVGGVAGTMGPAMLGRHALKAANASPAARWVMKNIAPFSDTGANKRATDRLLKLSAGPDRDIEALGEETIADLTSAQRVSANTGGEQGRHYLALEQAARDNDPVLDARLRKQADGAEKDLRQAISDMAEGGSAKDFAAFMRAERVRVENELTDAVAKAHLRADARVALLKPGQSAEVSSTILRAELDKALRAARAEESRLWRLVPRDVEVGTVNVRAEYVLAEEELGKATFNRMPPGLRKLLGKIPRSERAPEGMEIAGEVVPSTGRRLEAQESAHELIELMSEMRFIAREARAAGGTGTRTARIADRIADAALADLDAIAEVGATQASARAFSRTLHDMFTRGTVGDVLGYAKEGGGAVPTAMTGPMFLGRKGASGIVGVDDLRRAVGDSPDAMAAAEEYLKGRFTDYTMVKGKFNPGKAETFLKDNRGMLERYPNLKNMMHDSAQAGVIAEGLSGIAEGTIKKTGKNTVRGRIQSAKEGREYRAILDAQSTENAARIAVRDAKTDPTGAAFKGLKAAALDDLLARATTGDTLSGKSLRIAMRDNEDVRKALAEILTPAEMRRLGQISGELEAVAASRGGDLPNIGGSVMNDPLNKLINFLGTLLGSGGGVRAAKATGAHSLVMSGFFTRNAREMLKSMTNQQAEKLLREAVVNPEMMKTLLMGVDTSATAAKVARGISAFLGLGASQVGAAGIDRLSTDPRVQAPESAPTPPQRGGVAHPPQRRTDLPKHMKTVVLNRLEMLERDVGTLTVTSSYRTKAQNTSAGGAKNSKHLDGRAIDVSIQGLSPDDILNIAERASAAGFGGIGFEKGHLHLDTGKRRVFGDDGKFQSVPKYAADFKRPHMDSQFK